MTTARQYDSILSQYNYYNPSAAAGDNFMASLQTISVTSEGSGRSSIRGKGGDDMMSSLKSIAIDAQKEVTLQIATDVLYQKDQNGQSIGYNGLNDSFLKSIEVMDLTSHTARMEVDFDARMTNGFMSSLKTINMKMQNAANFYITSEGSSSVLNSLENITLAPTTGPVSFSVVNRQYIDDLRVLNAANSFMIAVQEINITAVGAINFELRNGLLNYSTYTLGDSGTGFLSSLQNINVDAGTSNVAFKFFNAATDASSLSLLNSVNIKGGEIRAEFSKYMVNEDWFNFATIQGTSDGVVERWNFNSDLRNEVQVFSGFDAGDTDDQLSFANIVNSLDDLIIQSVGDDVQIKFVDPAITGEVWILDVAASFSATDNILL